MAEKQRQERCPQANRTEAVEERDPEENSGENKRREECCTENTAARKAAAMEGQRRRQSDDRCHTSRKEPQLEARDHRVAPASLAQDRVIPAKRKAVRREESVGRGV